jgi:hypothetical protein
LSNTFPGKVRRTADPSPPLRSGRDDKKEKVAERKGPLPENTAVVGAARRRQTAISIDSSPFVGIKIGPRSGFAQDDDFVGFMKRNIPPSIPTSSLLCEIKKGH